MTELLRAKKASELKIFLSIIGLLFTSWCCQEVAEELEIQPDPNAVKIMPLGASRVEGARPAYESYRYELWKRMIENGWSIDYVGTQEDKASYPAVVGQGFDDDHEGRGGWTSGQIRDGLSEWLKEAGAPDIVLFSSPGGNDGLEGLPYEEAVINIRAIVEYIQEVNPSVTIIIEKMAPGSDEIMQGDLAVFFERMNEEVVRIAEEQSTVDSQVMTVDMHTGFTSAMLADEVHYNEQGAVFVAERYFSVLTLLIE
jgi:lysophospholipase L1-like esterase